MPSNFIHHFTQPLSPASPSLSFSTLKNTPPDSKRALHDAFLSLPRSQPLTRNQIQDALASLQGIDSGLLPTDIDVEESALKNAIISRVVVGLYAEAMEAYLAQATEVEAEAEWWAEIERSRSNIAWYLLQTTPSRLCNLLETIVGAVRSRNQSLTISTFTPSSLAKLFPSPSTSLRPSALTTALFPHITRSSLNISTYSTGFDISSDAKITGFISYYFNLLINSIAYPLSLTHQECKLNRRELEKIRNERAEILGKLSLMRNSLSETLSLQNTNSGQDNFLEKVQQFVEALENTINVNNQTVQTTPVGILQHLSNETLPHLTLEHKQMLQTQGLLRPRALVLMWPKLVLLPPIAFYAIKSLYKSRASLEEVAKDAVETMRGFVRGWLLEPLQDILKTVRSGSADEERVLVRREGVMADLDSLERMTLSLARDELKYDNEQLAALSRQIRLGDMTPVMQVYEEDIRRPLKSAVAGTLLRNVFIQVQKAKVDIDQALTGIDRLLKSQELTFAFVGVAPALAIVYLAGGALTRVWTGGKWKGRYGGLHRRRHVWDVMRRIERLLITQPVNEQQVAELPSGLLLLSLARLRSYAIDYLPSNSRLREGFLEDLDDLEDPVLGRDAKLEVIHRMWRCWGAQLGWEKSGEY